MQSDLGRRLVLRVSALQPPPHEISTIKQPSGSLQLFLIPQFQLSERKPDLLPKKKKKKKATKRRDINPLR